MVSPLPAPDVDVVLALREDRAAIASMMQLYTHDFSEQWAGTTRGELDAQGRFPEYPLDAYWSGESDRVPLLIRTGGHLAGFSLLNRVAPTGQPIDRNMGEFFVARKHRGSEVALAAAHQIFTRYPGVWEAAVTRRNERALAFWRKAAAQHPLTTSCEELDITSDKWTGPVLRFRIGPAAARA